MREFAQSASHSGLDVAWKFSGLMKTSNSYWGNPYYCLKMKTAKFAQAIWQFSDLSGVCCHQKWCWSILNLDQT
jgi:hypothetical protein